MRRFRTWELFYFHSRSCNITAASWPYIRKRIIVDLNPRGRITIPNVMDMLKTAGFQNIAWRPFFVPSDNEAARGCTENTQSVRKRAGSAPAIALEVDFALIGRGSVSHG